MKKVLVMLILGILFLGWNFVIPTDKKVDLTDPAKVLQGLSQALKYKLAVRQYWQKHDEFPTAADWQKLETRPNVDISRSLVTDINVGELRPGAITVYFSNKDVINVETNIDGKQITLIPVVVNERLDWICQGDMNRALMPEACRVINTGKQEQK